MGYIQQKSNLPKRPDYDHAHSRHWPVGEDCIKLAGGESGLRAFPSSGMTQGGKQVKEKSDKAQALPSLRREVSGEDGVWARRA